MRHKSLLILLTIVLLTFNGLSAEEFSESAETTLEIGEELKFGNHVIEYYRNTRNNEELKIGYDTGESLRVLERITQDEIYENEGEVVQISENLSLGINRLWSSPDGIYIDLEIYADSETLSSADMTTSVPSSFLAQQGDETTITLEITNTGLKNQTFSLDSNHSSPIDISFDLDGFTVSNIYVPAGDSESLNADLSIPQNTDPGVYELDINADNRTSLSETVELEILGAEQERNMNMNVRDQYLREQPGETVSSTIEIINNGDVALNNIEINTEAPEDWSYELEAEEIDVIQPFGRETVEIELDIPADADVGDDFIEVSVLSDETDAEETEEIRVNIVEESNMNLVGAALMALSLMMLLFVYRKFGRR